MNKTFKKIAASIMAATSLAVSMVGMSANAVYWNNAYGKATGTSNTTTWSTTGSPTFRKVTARTTITNAAPYIYAKIEGYVNNNLVLDGENTVQNSTVSVAERASQNYVDSSVTGNGTHAIWSSSLTRINHYSYF